MSQMATMPLHEGAFGPMHALINTLAMLQFGLADVMLFLLFLTDATWSVPFTTSGGKL